MTNSNKPLVLVADDDIVVLEILKETLLGAGYDVYTAADGNDAVDAYDRVQPDIVLLDVVMPGRDGFSVCSYIRSRPSGEHIPILIITARNSLATIHQAFNVGATDIVPKPINWTALLHRLHFILRASKAVREAKLTTARHQALLRAAPDLILRLQGDGTVIDVSTPLNAGNSNGVENFIGMSITALLPSEAADGLLSHIRRAVETGNDQLYNYNSVVNEKNRAFEIRLHTSVDHEVIAVIRDVTERLATESALHRLTYSDTLTGLANRQVGLMHLEQALETSKRRHQQTAVVCINVDFFQRVNDRYGHTVGDKVLIELTHRMRELLRRSDTLIRLMDSAEKVNDDWLGGDEIVLILSELQEAHSDAAMLSERVQATIREPVYVDGASISITASIGISCFPADGSSGDDLILRAVQAMKTAKNRGRNQIHFHSAANLNNEVSSPTIEHDTETRFFCFHPIMNAASSQIVAHEVSNQSNEGCVKHNRSNSKQTQAGFFLALDAIKTLVINSDKHFRFFVELPEDLCSSKTLPEQVAAILSKVDLYRVVIELGISEKQLMSDTKHSHWLIKEIRAKGFQLYLHAYSGESYKALTQFEIQQIKLSDDLVRAIATDKSAAKLAESIIHTAHHLGLHVISGSLHDDQMLDRMKKMGSELLLGDACAPSISLEDFSGSSTF